MKTKNYSVSTKHQVLDNVFSRALKGGETNPVSSFEVNGNKACFTAGTLTICLTSQAKQIIKCSVSKTGEFKNSSPLGITLPKSKAPNWTHEETTDGFLLSNGAVQVSVNKATGKLAWFATNGQLLCQENGTRLASTPLVKHTTGGKPPIIKRVKTVDGERNFIENLHSETIGEVLKATHHFCFQENESIHGLGQGEEGIYNYRNNVQYLYQHNMRTPIPFFMSSKKYAVLYDCACLMSWNDDKRGSYVFLDSVDQLNYYFLNGNSADELVSHFRVLTGKASLLPKWAYGFIQSKESYKTQDELIAVAKEYRKRNLPIDCVVQDWNTWEDGNWGNKQVDKNRFPNLSLMNKALHEMNVHSMVSVWPNMNPGCANHAEFEEQELLLQDVSTYNAFDEKARNLYWKQANEELFSSGFDAWWCDSTEPFSGPDWGGEALKEPWERFALVGNEHKKYLPQTKANLFANKHAQGMYENQKKAAPNKRMLNLTRSGTAGIQKHGTVLWSGDIAARWDVLQSQITEGLNMSLSGMPWWTLDIGAFFTVQHKWQNRGCGCAHNPQPLWFWQGDFEEGVDDLAYRELYVRWFQLGTFLPMLRSHGTDTPREIWQFGKPGEMFYDAIEKMMRLRYKLMPYIYSVAAKVHFENHTMLRSLLFDFANDETAAKLHDEFMFGDSLLVCPITTPMYYKNENIRVLHAKTHNCYLPAGTRWFFFWDDQLFDGGQYIKVDAPLDIVPIFVKEGTILITEKQLMYACQEVASPLEINIYPGKDAQTFLYEDAGDGYGYEKGEFNKISFSWSQETQTVSVGSAKQKFASSAIGRKLKMVLHGKNKTATIDYTGSPVVFNF